MDLKKNEYADTKDDILLQLGLLPLEYDGNLKYINDKIEYLISIEKYEVYSNFLNNYFLAEFTNYFKDGTLNYSLIPVEARTNSALENYNSYINRILGDKEEINWLNFITFLKDEVDRWQQKIGSINVKLIDVIKAQKKLSNKNKKKYKKNNKNNNNSDLFNTTKLNKKNEHLIEMIPWLINENYSCRYDCFLTLYTYIIKPFLRKDVIDVDEDLKKLNYTSELLLNNLDKKYRTQFWKYIDGKGFDRID